jgi:amino acid adenylation domain-containing protein
MDQNIHITLDMYQEAERYWLEQLSDEPADCRLHPSGRRESGFKAAAWESAVPEDILARLDAISKRNHLSLFTVLTALVKTALLKWTGCRDIVLFSPQYNPVNEEDGPVLFLDKLSYDMSFRDVVLAVKGTVAAGYKNQHFPLRHVFDRSGIPQSPALFRHGLALDNIHPPQRQPKAGDNVNHDWILRFNHCESQLTAIFDYNGNRFSQETIKRFFEGWAYISRQVLENTGILLGDIEMVEPAERELILHSFNKENTDIQEPRTFNQWFKEVADRHCDRIMLAYEEDCYTYRHIDQLSGSIGFELQKRGVGADTLVAVMSGGSVYLAAGLLAVMKAGGAYIPLAPDLPEERIRFFLQDSNATHVLVEPGVTLPADERLQVMDMRQLAEAGKGQTPAVDNNGLDLAYLIYTSGTTGRPKGTLVQHEGLVNYTRWRLKHYQLTEEDVTLQPLSYSFDGFCSNFYSAILSGGALVTAPDHKRKDFDYLRRLIRRHGVTNVSLVPGMYRVLLEGGRPEDFDSLRFVVLAGERAPSSLVTYSKNSYSHISLFNEYGPTEATVTAACNLEMSEDTSLVGRPLDNIQIYILDSYSRLMPVDVPGELCISGAGIARGYLNRPQMTAEKFAEHPFKPGERLYRTGDAASFTPDGDIRFLGRKELQRQVKIRGFRVELGEVETTLAQHPALEHVKVVAWRQENGEALLCGYVTSGDGEHPVDEEEILEFCHRRLPDYMVPSHLLALDSMPLDRHGKIDLDQLPDPRLLQKKEAVPPRNMLESGIQAIWSRILGLPVESFGIDDNFFQLGGHSLKATLLVSRIHKEFQAQLVLTDVFSQPTIRSLAALVESKAGQGFSVIQPAPKLDVYPLSPAQRRLFVLHQLSPQSTGYNIPQVLSLTGAVDRHAFQETFRLLVSRHESLRTSFQTVEGQPVQKIEEGLEFQLEYWQTTDEHDKKQKIRAFVRPFDLSRAPLMRVGLIEVSKEEFLLLTDLHHIIADGVSHAVLLQEFLSLHNGETLPPPALHYKDFSHWQASRQDKVQEQERFWLDELAGELPVLRLPTDFRRPPVLQFDGREERFFLDADVTERIKSLAQTTGSTMFMALSAVWNVCLSRLSGQQDIIVGTPVAGRKHTDLARVVGNFVNTLAIRTIIDEKSPFQLYLAQHKGRILEAFQHQDVQLEDIIDRLGVNRDTSRNPLFDVVFSYQDVEMEADQSRTKAIAGLNSTPYPFENTTAKFDLTLLGSMAADRLAFTLQFSTRLFKRTTIKRFIACFQRVAEQLSLDPGLAPRDLDIIDPREKDHILKEWNDTSAGYPQEATIQQLLARRVKENPFGVALTTYPGKEQFSYGLLGDASGKLATLCRRKGVRRGMIVPVLAEKGFEMMAALLGLVYAGAAYLPIDPSLPEGRVRYMLEDCGAGIVLTTDEQLVERYELSGYQIIMAGDWKTITTPDTNLESENRPEDPLYVIYTSGTTGKPKGVVVEHRNVVRLLFNDRFPFDFSNRDVWTMFHAFNFDFSVWEMYGSLLYGGRLVVVDRESSRDASLFLELLQREGVTVLNQTPTAFYTLSQLEASAKEGDELRLKTVVFGGEALNPAKLGPFHRRYPDAKLVNMFGITETTVHVTYKEITATEIELGRSQIGGPIPTLTVVVANSGLKLQPLGVPGELCVGGLGVARGYLNRPELTAEKFVDNPFDNKDRLYRSGDLARLWEDGELEYLGRIDHQVQIRGFRVELGEIESQLLTHPEVKEAVVRAIGSAAGDPVLHAFVIGDQTNGGLAALTAHLRSTLPEYMIPGHVHPLDSIPRTPNGKVDQRALETIAAGARKSVERLLPKSGMEKKIAAVWCEVLELEEVGVNENYFELGGNSLNIVLVNTRLKEELERDIPLIALFQHPTISALYLYLTDTPQSTQEQEDNVEETMSETVALFDNL